MLELQGMMIVLWFICHDGSQRGSSCNGICPPFQAFVRRTPRLEMRAEKCEEQARVAWHGPSTIT